MIDLSLKLRVGVMLVLLALLCHTPAIAAVSCTASMTNINYGTYTPWGANVDVTGTLTSSCNNTSLLGALNGYRICYTIITGSHPEVMTSGSNSLNHELYVDATRSQPWGDGNGGTFDFENTVNILNIGTYSLPNKTVYARLFGNQNTVPPGTYVQNFANTLLVAWKGQLLTPPSSCSSPDGTATFSFTAQASVLPQCDSGFTTSTLDFGTHGLITANVDATSTIGPRCTNSTPYQIGLDNGQNASGSVRRMISGSNYVSYELYRDAARTQRWGNTLNVDTVSATGTGSSQNITVYGRVAPQVTPPAGTYTDTVIVTITY